MIGIDIETTDLDPREGELRTVQFSDGREGGVIDAFSVDVAPYVRRAARKPLVAHNATFEELWLREKLGIDVPAMHDTMLAYLLLQQVDSPRAPQFMLHSLEHVAETILGEEMDKTEQKGEWASEVLTDAQKAYALKDAEVLVPLMDRLLEDIREQGMEFVYEIERRARPAFDLMTRHGVYVDRDQLDRGVAVEKAEYERLGEELQKFAPINWGSSKQLREYFELEDLPNWPTTPANAASTKAEHLERLDHPAAKTYLAWKKKQKMVTTYGDSWLAWIGPDSRLRPRWFQFGTVTGRVSCGNPNIQQVPREGPHRKAFVAPEGRVLVVADYSQIELRVIAKYLKDRTMLSIFADPTRDIHTEMARQISGRKEPTKEERTKAKAANFGLAYGAGLKQLKAQSEADYGVSMTENEARRIKELFKGSYKETAAWHERAYEYKEDGQYPETRTLAGRKRDKFRLYTDWLNVPIQGSAADGAKLALALLYERRADVKSAAPVNFIHDEIVLECDESEADDAKQWLEEAMRRIGRSRSSLTASPTTSGGPKRSCGRNSSTRTAECWARYSTLSPGSSRSARA
jgi:DNA polymerase-1